VVAANVSSFVYPGSRRAIAVNQDGSLNAPGNAEARGRVITVYVTGIGAVTPAIVTGEAAPLNRLLTAAPVPAKIGGVDAPVLFLGLAPGFIGLGQANLQIPEAAASGAEVALAFGTGSPATVSIR
jgi:uncharacterized protein (TIGR03437 family)